MSRTVPTVIGVLALLASLLLVTGVAVASDTVVVSGSGSDSGILFNADPNFDTPYEFSPQAASLGSSSLKVLPIQNDEDGNNDKFIALIPFGGGYFGGPGSASFESVSVDFQVIDESPASSGPAYQQFYINVYANAAGDSGEFYDCRYDYVATSGSETSFTELLAAGNATVVANRTGTIADCGSSPADLPSGAVVTTVAINIGDTSANDQGVGGYFDNIQVTDNGHTTTYNLELPDTEAPVVTDVTATPNPVAQGATLTVDALVDDSATGGSDIASAAWTLNASGGAMGATDSAFDSATENVTADTTAPAEAGLYDLCVTGTDSVGNTSAPTCIQLVVYDPDGGFVTGGGWIDSPQDAFKTPTDTIFTIGVDDGTRDEFFEEPNDDTNFVCDNPGNNGSVGTFVVGSTADALFPGMHRSSTASPTDGRYDASCNSVTIEFTTTQTYYDSQFLLARMGGEDTEVFLNGTSIGDTTATNPGVDPHPSKDYFFIPGALPAGNHQLQIVGIEDPDYADGYHWVDYLELTGNPAVTGQANFGFVSKYKKGADIPTGQTQFEFEAGNLDFHSTDYEWLVVTGADYAKFKGSGTINDTGDYQFMLWAGDNGQDGDTFRIKIWTEDNGIETVIYDNGMDQTINGGQIVVHTGKGKK